MAIPDTRSSVEPAVTGRRAGVVLIVDDDPLVGEIMRRAVTRAGRDVLLAGSPAQALELAASHPIAILVTDLTMPEMTGIELARRIREQHPTLPVILVSASPEASALAIDSPSWFLAKPFPLRVLTHVVASYTAPPSRAS